jgi:hypothetical protein
MASKENMESKSDRVQSLLNKKKEQMAKKKKWSTGSVDSKMSSDSGSTGGALEKAVNEKPVKAARMSGGNRPKFMNQCSKRNATQIIAAMDKLDAGGSIKEAFKGLPADARGAIKGYARSIGA